MQRKPVATYKLSTQAKSDVQRIYFYGLERYGETQADRYFHALFEQFGAIAEAPYQFPAMDDVRLGYRRCVCGADSIYFRLQGNTVEIMANVGRQFWGGA